MMSKLSEIFRSSLKAVAVIIFLSIHTVAKINRLFGLAATTTGARLEGGNLLVEKTIVTLYANIM